MVWERKPRRQIIWISIWNLTLLAYVVLKLRCETVKDSKHIQPIAEFHSGISVCITVKFTCSPIRALQFSSDPSPSLAVDWQSMFYRPCLYSDGDDWSSSVPPPPKKTMWPPLPHNLPPSTIHFQDILNWTPGLYSHLLRKSESVKEKEENWPSTYNKRCRNRWQDVLHNPRLENMKQNVSFIYENFTLILIYGAVLNQALKNQNYNNHSANQNKGLYFQ